MSCSWLDQQMVLSDEHQISSDASFPWCHWYWLLFAGCYMSSHLGESYSWLSFLVSDTVQNGKKQNKGKGLGFVFSKGGQQVLRSVLEPRCYVKVLCTIEFLFPYSHILFPLQSS